MKANSTAGVVADANSSSSSSSSSSSLVPISTSSILLETSAGAFVVDLFGCDCPALTGAFANLCRAKFWNGAAATEVVPDVAVFFSHAADAVYDAALLQTLSSHSSSSGGGDGGERRPTPSMPNDFWHLASLTDRLSSTTVCEGGLERQQRLAAQAAREEFVVAKKRISRMSSSQKSVDSGASISFARSTADGGGGAGALGRKGLVIVEASPMPPSSSTSNSTTSTTAAPATASTSTFTASSQIFRFGLTLSDRAMDFLDGRYIAIGAVREGFTVLDAIRRAPSTTATTTTTSDVSQEVEALPSGSAAPLHVHAAESSSSASLYLPDVPRWPRPLRMLRVKHVTVLPTPGTEPFLLLDMPPTTVNAKDGKATPLQERKRRIARVLAESGCFTYWAAQPVVSAASHHIAAAVAETESVYKRLSSTTATTATATTSTSTTTTVTVNTNHSDNTPRTTPQALVQLPSSTTSTSNNNNNDNTFPLSNGAADDVVSVEYNPHATGVYLSSDEDEESGGGGTPVDERTDLQKSGQQRRQEREARRTAVKQLHQAKANETLTLMLNILNGVADVSGDLRPPDNVLFVCKLNPVTTSQGLAMCFAQFGHVLSAEVVSDKKTGQSLCYGFVEFASVDACYRAFQKMDRALVDDCRIHVDFSQSVSKLWFAKKREMRKRVRGGE